MDINNIVKLQTNGKSNRKSTPKVAKAMSARMARRLTLQHGAGVLIALVATAMTCVSLSHIAGGIEHLTHGAIPTWQSWAASVGIDINYIGMEMASVVACYTHVRNRLHRYTR